MSGQDITITVPMRDVAQIVATIAQSDLADLDRREPVDVKDRLHELLAERLLNDGLVGLDETLQYHEHFDARSAARLCSASIKAVSGSYFP